MVGCTFYLFQIKINKLNFLKILENKIILGI